MGGGGFETDVSRSFPRQESLQDPGRFRLWMRDKETVRITSTSVRIGAHVNGPGILWARMVTQHLPSSMNERHTRERVGGSDPTTADTRSVMLHQFGAECARGVSADSSHNIDGPPRPR